MAPAEAGQRGEVNSGRVAAGGAMVCRWVLARTHPHCSCQNGRAHRSGTTKAQRSAAVRPSSTAQQRSTHLLQGVCYLHQHAHEAQHLPLDARQAVSLRRKAGKDGRQAGGCGQQRQPQRWLSSQQRSRQCTHGLPHQTAARPPSTHLGFAGCRVLGAEGLLGAACGHVHVAALVVAEAEDVLQSRVGEWQARKRLTAGCCMWVLPCWWVLPHAEVLARGARP